jgi:hypothetical protein
LSIGLKQLVGGDAQTYIHALEEILDDIASSCSTTESEKVATKEKLLVSIENTMSDQCSVNHVFNKMLQDMRAEVLPKYIDNYEK